MPRQAGAPEGEDEITSALVEAVTNVLMDHFWGEARHLQLVAEDDAGFALTELEAHEIATNIITALA